MKKIYLILAAAVGMTLASCTSDEYVGTNNPYGETAANDGSIRFGFNVQGMTRADIYGQAAATLLGNNFYVTGTKGTEAETSPSPTLVFDNYLVHFGANTAGKTASNTANWEYVGIDQGADTKLPENYDRVKLSSIEGAQTIKYWDYSAAQYDFLAFSTGTYKAVSKTTLTGDGRVADDEIGVTAMKHGTGLASSTVAYTFYVPTVDAIKNAYITDITTVEKANYKKEVQLRFKNLGSKIRIAMYETVPGYSVKDVQFYTVDAGESPSDLGEKGTTATLISADANGLPTKGQINVYFPHVGTTSKPGATGAKADYNKAAATVIATTTSSVKTQGFGALASTKLKAKERAEKKWSGSAFVAEDANVFLGRTLSDATFAGDKDADFYQTVFPVSSSSALTLRVNYTLVPIDGATETIVVKGAKAVVPATYTKWLPNYAYTYIFKISDNTNGWTGAATDEAGLFPITFDAVVAEATDATAEQTTITTVATPSITTYQQGHDINKNEYSIATGKDIYVQVMDNKTATPTLVGDLNDNTPTPTQKRALLYKLDNEKATEALVMDALQNRKATMAVGNVTGRNGLTLTNDATNIDPAVTTIVNGPDDNPITQINGTNILAGQVAKIAITASGFAAGTYAFVYDYTTSASPSYDEVTELQPIYIENPGTTTLPETAESYYTLTTTQLDGISVVTAANEAVDKTYIYFSKTTDGTGTTTYSYVSVVGKTNLPAGLIKVGKTVVTGSTPVAKGTKSVANTFYFDKYFSNKGKYAVKVIKIVAS